MLSRRLVICSIALLLFGAAALQLNAQTAGDVRTERTQRYLARLGTGKRVVVTVDSGHKIKGDVLDIQDDSFEVRSKGQGQSTKIMFSDVKDIKRPGVSRAVKVGIVVTAVVIGLIVAAKSIPIGPTFR